MNQGDGRIIEAEVNGLVPSHQHLLLVVQPVVRLSLIFVGDDQLDRHIVFAEVVLYIVDMKRCLCFPLLLILCFVACDVSGLILPPAGEALGGGAAEGTGNRYRALVDTLGQVVGTRDLGQLEPLLTARLASSLLDVVQGSNGDRFWRHLGGLERGIRGGYTFPKALTREDGRLELPLHFKTGGNAQLVLKEEGGQLRIDRF